MNDHVRAFLQSLGPRRPMNFGGRRADAPSALLSRAARRNKLRVTKARNNHYVVTGGRRVVGGFAVHVTSLPSSESVRASLSMPLAKRYLELDGLPVPMGAQFLPEDIDEALSFFDGLSAAAVVKPASPSRGAGVHTGITTREEFLDAWQSASGRRPTEVGADTRLMVEEEVRGLDVRAFVVGEKVVAAVARVPLFCIADGVRTLGDQIEELNALRAAHPLLGKFDHDAESYARAAGHPLKRIPSSGDLFQLAPGINMRTGGVTVDVTDLLGTSVIDLAVAAAWSVPGSKAAGVDLIVPETSTSAGAKVLHVDVQTGFTTHHYPWIGERRPVANALIEKMREVRGG